MNHSRICNRQRRRQRLAIPVLLVIGLLLLTNCFECINNNESRYWLATVEAFSPPLPQSFRTKTTTTTTTLLQASSLQPNNNNNNQRNRQQGSSRKKTFADRTPEEAAQLLQEIIQATLEAGPRAGPTRTLQAYLAFVQTAADFMPPGLLPPPPFWGNNNNLFNFSPPQQQEAFSPPVALRKLFERLGATYIKLGQFIASSPTLFPKEYVKEFQKCLDQTEPLPYSTIRQVLAEEWGGESALESKFLSIDPQPLASASIAQVHRATLRNPNPNEPPIDVVLKVQKPNLQDSLQADLGFLVVASRVLEFLQPDWERTSLSAIAGDLRDSMMEELDFNKEARNMQDFAIFLRDNQFEDVATVPRVYSHLTTRRVLVMEYLDGVSLLDEQAISNILTSNNSNNNNDKKVASHVTPESIIVTALNVWTMSVQRMPWFHADVHAGNLLCLPDGRVGFLDFGIVGRVSESTFQAVQDLSTALALGDYEGVAVALCQMGATDATVDTKQFGRDIEQVLSNLNTLQPTAMGVAGTTPDEDELTNVLLEIVKVTEDNGLRLPREFGLLVKQSLYFDRYLKILAPDLDIMADDRVGLGGTSSSSNQQEQSPPEPVMATATNSRATSNGSSNQKTPNDEETRSGSKLDKDEGGTSVAASR